MKIDSHNININKPPTIEAAPSGNNNGYWTLNDAPSPSSTVTLSDEGKQRSKDYGQTLKQPIDEANSPDKAKKEGDMLDEQMEEIKEKMTELQQQISALAGDNSEEAQNQLKLLNSQLMGLSAQLIELASQKILKDKQGSPAK